MSALTLGEKKALRVYSENMTWFRTHYTDLAKDYADKYVAVNKGGVVDSDSNPERLLERVRNDEIAVGYVPRHEMELIL